MTRYVAVSDRDVPLGKTALLLFVHEAELCAGTVEHRYDGRILRRLPDRPQARQLVMTICALMNGRPLDDTLYIVIDQGAFWPDAFPALQNRK